MLRYIIDKFWKPQPEPPDDALNLIGVVAEVREEAWENYSQFREMRAGIETATPEQTARLDYEQGKFAAQYETAGRILARVVQYRIDKWKEE